MDFAKNYIYWTIGGIIVIGLIVAGAIYYKAPSDDETKFIIAPLDELDVLPYDFSEEFGDGLETYIKEIKKILPLPSNDSSSIPTPAPTPILPPEETPWEQGPSDQEVVIPSPTPPPPSETPWGQGLSR